jgi:hypothetical protein
VAVAAEEEDANRARRGRTFGPARFRCCKRSASIVAVDEVELDVDVVCSPSVESRKDDHLEHPRWRLFPRVINTSCGAGALWMIYLIPVVIQGCHAHNACNDI